MAARRRTQSPSGNRWETGYDGERLLLTYVLRAGRVTLKKQMTNERSAFINNTYFRFHQQQSYSRPAAITLNAGFKV